MLVVGIGRVVDTCDGVGVSDGPAATTIEADGLPVAGASLADGGGVVPGSVHAASRLTDSRNPAICRIAITYQ